jgi:hypothetical protein
VGSVPLDRPTIRLQAHSPANSFLINLVQQFLKSFVVTAILFEHVDCFFELHSTSETLTTHTLIPMNTPAQTLPLRPSSKIGPTNSQRLTKPNLTSKSIFEGWSDKSSRLTKSPQAPRCRREHRLPLKAQTLLNPEKFAPTESLSHRCY